MNEKIIQLPLIRQYHDTEDSEWAPKTCALSSLEMLLEYLKFPKSSIMELVNEANVLNGYIPNVGWRHKVVIELAQRRGLSMDFLVQFPKALEEKKKYIEFIHAKIEAGLPVLASMYSQLDKNNGGHVVVINGIGYEGKDLLGFFIQDPNEYLGKHNYFLGLEVFLDNWRGGLIYVS
jgi:hypothetical protein